ncbi:MAG: histidinol-phosphate transaminase [Clostridia bacterium]|nr:histidinol-phosphate transaminase [Clostridia bacterium]MBO4428769.1 histidinol-phosphate transaminase [Clostridia bacterium]
MKSFMVKRYSSLEAYVPGEQPHDLEYVKLNTNESPFPPSPKVAEILRQSDADKLKLYPDPEGKDLCRAIAAHFGVKKENVLLGNGSDEILAFAFFAFCAGEKCVFPDISYGFYKVFAELAGADYKEIPLKSDFSIDVFDYEHAGATVIIANPNAPTGVALTAAQVEQIVRSNPDNVVVIDEAYVDFGAESAVTLTKKYENLVVVQTYSKSRSLAGARLGFAIASEGLIADMNRIKYSLNPYNINRLTLLAGEASIGDDEYFKETTEKIIENREYTARELKKRGFYVTDSKTNFLFAKTDAVGGKELYLGLKKRGVLVRHFDKEKIKDFVRITIGTREQTDILLKKTDEILKEAKNG